MRVLEEVGGLGISSGINLAHLDDDNPWLSWVINPVTFSVLGHSGVLGVGVRVGGGEEEVEG